MIEEKSKFQSEAHENKDIINFFPPFEFTAPLNAVSGAQRPQVKKLCNELGLFHDNGSGGK